MSKLQVPVSLIRGRKEKTVQVIVDGGSDITVFPRTVARSLGLCKPRNQETESLGIMGRWVNIWYTCLDIHIPDTDCLVENFTVGFVDKGEDREDDLIYGILGTDFLQMTGGILDYGHGRHAIACDPAARGVHSDSPVMARRKRLKRR